jgi:hypothetical protein
MEVHRAREDDRIAQALRRTRIPWRQRPVCPDQRVPDFGRRGFPHLAWRGARFTFPAVLDVIWDPPAKGICAPVPSAAWCGGYQGTLKSLAYGKRQTEARLAAARDLDLAETDGWRGATTRKRNSFRHHRCTTHSLPLERCVRAYMCICSTTRWPVVAGRSTSPEAGCRPHGGRRGARASEPPAATTWMFPCLEPPQDLLVRGLRTRRDEVHFLSWHSLRRPPAHVPISCRSLGPGRALHDGAHCQ